MQNKKSSLKSKTRRHGLPASNNGLHFIAYQYKNEYELYLSKRQKKLLPRGSVKTVSEVHSDIMSRKKGMSRDDKLIAMQELMMESQDIWTLKDLERDCPKKKGITAMSVKEILQELCDNDLVSFEKIGSGNFYWCFPSEAFNRRKVLEGKLEEQISELETEISGYQAEIADLEPGREPCQERTELDAIIEQFSRQLAEIKAETSKYDSLNPEAIRKTQEQTKFALESANRWTDNIYTLKSWIVKTYGFNPTQFDEQFGLGDNFDYFQ